MLPTHFLTRCVSLSLCLTLAVSHSRCVSLSLCLTLAVSLWLTVSRCGWQVDVEYANNFGRSVAEQSVAMAVVSSSGASSSSVIPYLSIIGQREDAYSDMFANKPLLLARPGPSLVLPHFCAHLQPLVYCCGTLLH